MSQQPRNSSRKADDLNDIYTGDFTPEELEQRRRIAQQARAGEPLYPRHRKKKRTFFQKYGVLLFMAAFILIMAGLITWVLEWPERRAKAQSLAALSEQQALAASLAALDSTATGPMQQFGAYTVQPMNLALMTQPENGRVDLTYFLNALFIGDSLTQGFQVYENGLKSSRHAAYVGATPKTITDNATVQNYQGSTVAPQDEILGVDVSKIYVMFGTNALPSQTDEAFLKYYGDFMDWLQANKPGCVIYIQAIPPVSVEKSGADSNFSKERISGLNAQIAAMAYARGMHYLDIYTALADENGDLRADLVSGSDGYHLNNDGYGVWRDYLQTHAVYSSDNIYVSGSPAYRAG